MIKDINGNNRSFYYGGMQIVGTGGYGTIYKLNDSDCLKKFDLDLNNNSKFLINNNTFYLPDIFNHLLNNKYSNLCDIKELLFDEKNILVGYIMEYLERDYLNILLKPTDFLLDNFNDLYKNIIDLSKNGYLLWDLRLENSICTKDKIKLIDFDLYEKSKNSFDYLKYYNTRLLLMLFNSLIGESLLEIENVEKLSLELTHYFDFSNKNYDNVINNINKELVKYKRPVDYYRNDYR